MQWLRYRLQRMTTTTTASSSDTSPAVCLNPTTDLVIVAGDISHDLDIFTETLSLLRRHCHVLFVPGNHEAWCQPSSPQDTPTTSWEKLEQCLDICRSLQVYVDPVYIDDGTVHGQHSVWILPLQSWYDGSLSFDEELCAGFDVWPWADFKRCVWGPDFPAIANPSTLARIPHGVANYFLECNRVNVWQPWQRHVTAARTFHNDGVDQRPLASPMQPLNVITVSHFLPNQQCLPDWKDLQSPTFSDAWLDHGAGAMSAKFAKVAGCDTLDLQLRRELLPLLKDGGQALHVFGHSHRPKDFVWNGIRYVHNPLGKPRERELHMVAPDVDFACVWNVKQQGMVSGRTVIRYWEEYGGGKEMLWQRMALVNPGRYQQQNGLV
jgi:Calcineurin-like phosphoesterase